jgi:hypothetical protein
MMKLNCQKKQRLSKMALPRCCTSVGKYCRFAFDVIEAIVPEKE